MFGWLMKRIKTDAADSGFTCPVYSWLFHVQREAHFQREVESLRGLIEKKEALLAAGKPFMIPAAFQH